MSTMLAVIIGLLALGGVQSAGIFGPCPKRPFVNNPELTRYLGRWYQQASMGIVIDVLATRCDAALYTLVNSTTINVTNTARLRGSNSLISWDAFGVAQEDGSLSIIAKSNGINAPYYILGTDYDTYAVVASCLGTKSVHAETGWILTRQPYVTYSQVPADIRQTVEAILSQAGLSKSLFLDADNSNCPPL